MEYIAAKDVAKYVRKALKEMGVKASVCCRRGSGSIDIYLKEPMESNRVEALRNAIDHLHGEGFDGMIDMRYGRYHWLTPEGLLRFAGTEGTSGSAGYVPALSLPPPCDGCKKVQLMNSFLFINRFNGCLA